MVWLAKGSVLPISEQVIQLQVNDEHCAFARAIAKTCAKNGRTLQAVEEECTRSLAIERAVFEYLISQGCEVLFSPGAYHYDGIVNGVLVDIKARLDGNWWQQTEYEARTLKQNGDRVLYFCVLLTLNLDVVFKGCCWVEDLLPSNYGKPYVDEKALMDFNF